jgi:hypothetical protein
MNATASSPVFVHAWWRAASTWFWAKLRDQAGLRCYYEPLNERLAYWTAPRLRAHRPDPATLRRSKHPPMERPYFAEYLELYEAGGTGYAIPLSYERYLLAPEEEDAALERYLAGLIAHAAGRGERAVLCFVRSPLRALWMKRRFGGLHLAQLRNPRDQWASFRAQGKDGRSYFTMGLALIAAHMSRRLPAAFAGMPPLPHIALKPRALSSDGPALPAEAEYRLFMLLWLASALQSMSAAELVLDSDRLSADAKEREAAKAALAAQGLRADLSDAAAPGHAELPLDAPALRRAEEWALRRLAGESRTLALFEPARVAAGLERLAPFSRELVQRSLAASRGASATRGARSRA